MKRVVFARFRDTASARAAVADLGGHPGARPLRILTHEHAHGDRLGEQVQHSEGFAETDMKHGFAVGIVVGTLVGTAVGVGLFAWLFGATVLTMLVGAGFGALMGAFVGSIMSGIVGTGLVDRRLSRLARGLEDGEVIVTIEAAAADERDRIERTILLHGGRFADKSPA